MRFRHRGVPSVCGFVIALAALLSGAPATFAQAPTPVVRVMPVPILDVSPSAEFIGRVEAINAVDIRARIEGILEQRLFEEGQMVQEGQDLYHIETDALEISLAAAQAQVVGAQATLREAEERLQRNLDLRRTQTISQATLSETQAARDTARASVLTAEANVRHAEVNLGYATIKAPITGRVGRAAFSVGSLVGPSSGPLLRIVQQDPTRVVFSVSDRAILQFRTGAGDLSIEETVDHLVPTLRLSTGEPYPASGTIEFLGNEVDQQTATVPIWARFPNPQSILIPGQFVTVVLRPPESRRRPMVPVATVEQDKGGRFVLILEDGNKVAVRRIRIGAQIEQNWVVEEGLNGGERLIVDGFQNARPGAVVRPVEAEGGALNAAPDRSAARSR
jgi:membrane fusion protein, multidrug efflux system